MPRLKRMRMAAPAALLLMVLWAPVLSAQGGGPVGPPPPPPTGNGMISFDAGNKDNAANRAGVITVTASAPGKPDLNIEVPVAVNATVTAIAASAKFLAPAAWQDCLLAAGSSLTVKNITKLDGDPGETGVKMTWTVTNKHVTTTTTGGKRVKGKKTGDGGRGGKFTVAAGGLSPNGTGGVVVASATGGVWFDAHDSVGDILARLAAKLDAEGWTVAYDVERPDELAIYALPGGIPETTFSFGVAYSDDVLPEAVEYHWEVGTIGSTSEVPTAPDGFDDETDHTDTWH